MTKYIIKILSVLLVCMICFTSVSACSGKVEFFDDSYSCQYEDNIYVPYNLNYASAWYPLPSSEQIEKVDKMPFALFRTFSRKPIYATLEDSPKFLIVSYKDEVIERYRSFAYIREDVELSSPFETVYEKIEVKYNNYVQNGDKLLKENLEGLCFNDFVIGEGFEQNIHADNISYICELRCSYPGIEYLKCCFTVFKAYGQYYLSVENEEFERLYYNLNPELLKELE